MRNRFLFTATLFCVLSGIVLKCTTSVSGVETTNGFSVTATTGSITGKAPAYAQVFLFDTGFVPYLNSGTGLITTADAAGHFRFAATSAICNILVVDSGSNSAGILTYTPSDFTDTNPSPASLSRQLSETGTLEGSLHSPGEEQTLLYLPGLCYYRIVNGSDSFTFPALPPGTYHLRIMKLRRSPAETDYDTTVTVESGTVSYAGEISIE